MEYQKVRLESINNGAAQELFEEEFKKVLTNINDISVEADAVREIKLVFKIKPSKDRQTAITTVEAHSKLATVMPHSSSIYLSFRDNKPEAFVSNMKQTSFDFTEPKKESKGE